MKKLFTLTLCAALLVPASIHAAKKPFNLKHGKEIKALVETLKAKSTNPENYIMMHHALNNRVADLKTEQQIKQRLDSLFYEVFDGESTYYPFSIQKFEYNEYQQLIKNSYFEYDFDIQSWRLNGAEELFYNENGLPSIMIYYETGEDGQNLFPQSMIEISYNENNQPAEELISFYSPDSSEWVLLGKQEYAYENGLLAFTVMSYLNYDLGEWIANWKDEYLYNESNLLTAVQGYMYNMEDSSWMHLTQILKEYNNNSLIRITYSAFDFETGEFVNSFKDEYQYDESGNIIQMMSSDWIVELLDWLPTFKEDLEYNNNYGFNDLIIPFTDDVLMFFNHQVTGYTDYYWFSDNTKGWITDGTGSFYYSEQTINAVEQPLSTSKLIIYPNPASENITITYNGMNNIDIAVFDITGKKVMDLTNSTNQINVSKLANGYYMLVVKSNGQIIGKEKLIKY